MTKRTITEVEQEAIRVWGYDVWVIHWKELAPVSNSRAQFLKYAYKRFEDLTQAEMDRIKLAVMAQTKHWRMKKKADGKVIGIPTLAVWFNQYRYDDEFIDESAASLRERTASSEHPICNHNGCTQPSHGYLFKQCIDHLPDPKPERLRAAYKSLNFDPDRPKIDQCREMARKALSGGLYKSIP